MSISSPNYRTRSNRQLNRLTGFLDPAENGSVADIQKPTNDAKAQALEIHIKGKLTSFSGAFVRTPCNRVMILAMFPLVPLPPAGKTSLGVFNATETRTSLGEIIKINEMSAKNMKTIYV